MFSYLLIFIHPQDSSSWETRNPMPSTFTQGCRRIGQNNMSTHTRGRTHTDTHRWDGFRLNQQSYDAEWIKFAVTDDVMVPDHVTEPQIFS